MASTSNNEVEQAVAKPGGSKENPTDTDTSACPGTSVQSTVRRCYFCQKAFFIKRVLRLVIRECPLYVTILLIRVGILDGVVTLHCKKTINFLKLGSEQRGFYPSRDSLTQRCHLPRFHIFDNVCDEAKIGIVESFVKRFASNLKISGHLVEENIDYVMTSNNEVLLDINVRKINMILNKCAEGEIECAIINAFWKPTSLCNVSVHGDIENDWFRAVDQGRVIPFYSLANVVCFKNPNITEELLKQCIHEIEERTVNAFSWYFEENFYHDFVYPRYTLPYSQYLIYQKTRKVVNSKVVVVEDNPFELTTNFAHLLPLNFYSHHKYVRNYLRDIGVSFEAIIQVNKNIPFIVRCLNPVTRMHMFHMVYKMTNYSRPSYEHVYKVFIMLRDAMFRLGLKDVAMAKIGCCCERLDFAKVLRMVEYIFLNTDIKVRIGLNLIKCWHLHLKSAESEDEPAEQVDQSAKRIDRYFACDKSIDVGRSLDRVNDVD